MWALIEACFADARKADELLSDLAARRELRLDRDAALAGFALLKVPFSAKAAAREVYLPRRSRTYGPVRM